MTGSRKKEKGDIMHRRFKLLLSVAIIVFTSVLILHNIPTEESNSFIDYLERYVDLNKKKQIDAQAIREVRKMVPKYTDQFGRITPGLQDLLYKIEEKFSVHFTDAARSEFQSMVAEVGGKMRGRIQIPTEQTPFWLLHSEKYAHLRSTPSIPKKADIVVIGAGLTGASAAYHLSKMAPDKKVVVVEADRPAAQSSGRNGGNFQLLAESYTGNTYRGLVEERVKWLKSQRKAMNQSQLRELAEEQAKALLLFSTHNADRFKEIVKKEKIDCDFSSSGWLRIAMTREEECALFRDIAWKKSLNMGFEKKMEQLSPEEIYKRFKIHASYSGRFIKESGNYHPYKFVIGLLEKAMNSGVSYYSGVKVTSVSRPRNGEVTLKTSEGIIQCKKVIVATNAFTPNLFKELKAIQCVPSQVMNLEHVPNYLRGATITARGGDFYFNYPKSTQYIDKDGIRRGMVHLGLDYKEIAANAAKLTVSESVFREMKQFTDRIFPDTISQPPSRIWTGPMAFTPDRVPVIGFMYYAEEPEDPVKNILIAASFQGYGGSYCVQAGYVVASMALSGKTHPDVPEEMFSPKRFQQ